MINRHLYPRQVCTTSCPSLLSLILIAALHFSQVQIPICCVAVEILVIAGISAIAGICKNDQTGRVRARPLESL